MGRKSNKRKQRNGGEQPPAYDGEIGTWIKRLRAATHDDKLDSKILLKMARAYEENDNLAGGAYAGSR